MPRAIRLFVQGVIGALPNSGPHKFGELGIEIQLITFIHQESRLYVLNFASWTACP